MEKWGKTIGDFAASTLNRAPPELHSWMDRLGGG